MHNGMQKNTIARTFLFVSVIAIFFGSYTIPTVAQASTTTVTCQTPVVGEFTPHIYDGELNSFDYTIESPLGDSYLPLSVAIGDVDIDLRYVSVWHNQGPNKVLIHVDVPYGTPYSGDTAISVRNIQLTQGPPPLCITETVFHVNLPASYTPYVPTTPDIPSTPYVPVTPLEPSQTTPEPESTAPTTTGETETISEATSTAALAQCTALGYQWLVLLALLNIIISALLLLAMSFIASSNIRLALAVLLPPALFIGIWYIFNSCHSDVWFPILAVILAIIVLTASGTPGAFESTRVRIMHFFGRRVRDTRLKLSEATSIMEMRNK